MIRLRHVLLVGALLVLPTASTQAGIYYGSLGVYGVDLVPTPTDLYNSQTWQTSKNTALVDGTFGFVGVLGADFTGTLIDLNHASNGYDFTMSSADWGTFDATGNLGYIFADNRPSSATNPPSDGTLTLAVSGKYTGGNNNPGFDGRFSGLITYTQTGGSMTQQITLQVWAVPEPSSVALGAIGLVSVGLVALRKRRASK